MGRSKRRRRNIVPLDSQSQYVALMKWMKQNNFKSSKLLKPADFPDTGRGMMAIKKICSGDSLVSIPRKLLITTATVLDSHLGPFIKMWSNPKLTPRQILVIFLVYEKYCNVLSPWKPYLHTLPALYSVPACWTQMPSCMDFSLKERITDQIGEVRQVYESCLPFLEHIGHSLPVFRNAISYERFLWGWFTVQTRAVYLEQLSSEFLSPERDHYALAPYLDFLNHCPNAKVLASFNEVTEQYEIISLTPYRKYDQVFINYGPRDNLTLLLDYGFVTDENPHNVVQFTIDNLYSAAKLLPAQHQPDLGIQKRLQILSEQNLIRDLTCSLDGPSWNFQVVLRILVMKHIHMQTWSLALHDTFSKQHQQAVTNCFKICLEHKLKTYPTDKELQQLGASTEVGYKLVSKLMKQQADILKMCLSQQQT